MGDLPVHRVNAPNRPFTAAVVDYTGAIEIKAARLRGTSTYKGYIAIFVCLATKAVHLEALTDSHRNTSYKHFLVLLVADDQFNIRIATTEQISLAPISYYQAHNRRIATTLRARHVISLRHTPPISEAFGRPGSSPSSIT